MQLAAIMCICVAVVMTIVLLTVFVLKTRAQVIARNAQKNGGKAKGDTVFRIISAQYPKKYVFRHVRLRQITVPSLPAAKTYPEKAMFVPSGEEERHFTPVAAPKYCGIDYLVIGRGGVTVIAASDMGGFIENPMRGDWRQFLNGEPRRFANPFEQCRIRERALTAELKRNGVGFVKTNCLLVFTNPDVKFKNRFRQIVDIQHLPTALADINREKILYSSDMEKISQFLSRGRK